MEYLIGLWLGFAAGYVSRYLLTRLDEETPSTGEPVYEPPHGSNVPCPLKGGEPVVDLYYGDELLGQLKGCIIDSNGYTLRIYKDNVSENAWRHLTYRLTELYFDSDIMRRELMTAHAVVGDVKVDIMKLLPTSISDECIVLIFCSFKVLT